MSADATQQMRFKFVLMWGGLVMALLGIVLILSNQLGEGLLIVVAGVLAFLYAKRKSRRTAS
jgi:uncharacterized membrane protein YccC